MTRSTTTFSQHKAKSASTVAHDIDHREQLVNGGEIGPITQVSIPVEAVTRLNGILLDIDPKLFRTQANSKIARNEPTQFYSKVIKPMLQRNSLLAKAQVRVSGSGLHLILWLDVPVTFKTDRDRQYWALVVKIIQRVLPSDPDAPGITALTRPTGSTNSKNGARVKIIAKGEPVTAAEVLTLVDEMNATPVRTVMKVVLGTDRVAPCPICRGKDTALAAIDRVAKCYGSCGNVKLGQIYDLFLRPRPQKKGR